MRKTIIILHGWGLFGKRYKELQSLLEQNGYQVFAPDMPGFGEEPLVKDPMSIDDYVRFVVQYMKKKKIKKASFIGHSFGGRVLAKLAVTHPELIERIVFTGSPLIRQKLSLKKRIIQKVVRRGQLFVHFAPKFLQKFIRYGLYRFIGEFDYYKAQKLRETFKKVINENSSSYVNRIKTQSLVIWGENDRIALLEYGKKMTDILPNAKLVVIKNAGHGIPYTHTKKFAQQVLSFFNN